MVEPTPFIDKLNLAVAVFGLVIAGLGFLLALRTLDRGNRNSSAALVYSMQLGFHAAWESYLAERDPDQSALKMSNILGLIETSAAIYCDTAMVGSSGQLMEEYLRDILRLIASRPELVAEVGAMRHTSTTFMFLDRFIDAMDAQGHASEFLSLRGPRVSEPQAEGFVYERRGGYFSSAWHNFNKPDFPGAVPLIARRFVARQRLGAPVTAPATILEAAADVEA